MTSNFIYYLFKSLIPYPTPFPMRHHHPHSTFRLKDIANLSYDVINGQIDLQTQFF